MQKHTSPAGESPKVTKGVNEDKYINKRINLLAFKIHIALNLLVSNYTIWYMQHYGLTLQSAVAHLKVKCGKMLTTLSLPSQHQGHHCICIAVSLSISLWFSFTLWMVHLAYKTEWIHNPGQFKIPRGPVGIKMKAHKQKKLLHCRLQQPFMQLFCFHVVVKHARWPRTQKGLDSTRRVN